jgi:hypothetical protein
MLATPCTTVQNQRCHHQLDQLEEIVSQRLHRLAKRRMEIAQRNADDDGHQNLQVEIPVPLLGVDFARCVAATG